MKKIQRKTLIIDIINHNQVFSQEQLASLLLSEGVEVTQTTLSRDLAELNILKGSSGYVIQEQVAITGSKNLNDIEKVISQYVVYISPAASLVVLKTNPGHAQLVGFELDSVKVNEIVGNVSGDDTIFIATPSIQDALALSELFKQWIH
ncbi:MAG: hypothetical protein AAGB12_13895 [Pseudomonadota bacterium]